MSIYYPRQAIKQASKDHPPHLSAKEFIAEERCKMFGGIFKIHQEFNSTYVSSLCEVHAKLKTVFRTFLRFLALVHKLKLRAVPKQEVSYKCKAETIVNSQELLI